MLLFLGDDANCDECSTSGTGSCFACNEGYIINGFGQCDSICESGCPDNSKCTDINVCSCNGGFYHIGQRCEAWTPSCDTAHFEAYPPTEFNDRICEKLTECRATEYELTPPTYTTDRVCRKLKICDPETYYEIPATTTTDRTCLPLSKCAQGQYIKVPRSKTSDRICDNWKTCTPDEYESFSGTLVEDRVCTPLDVCDLSTQFVKKEATAVSNRICAPFERCTSFEFEAQPPTSTTDRVCEPITICRRKQYEVTPPTATSDRICEGLSRCRAGEYEIQAATATSDRECAQKPQYTVSGTVTTFDGEPIPDAKVAVSSTNFAFTDKNGQYAITGVRATNVLIAVFKPFVISQYQKITISGDTVVNFGNKYSYFAI